MAEIAVSLAIEILKKASSVVVDLIKEEGARFSKLNEKISWIEREMGYYQNYLKSVEHKRDNTDDVTNFIRDVRIISFEVEDTVEIYLPLLLLPKRKGFKGFLKRIPHIFSDYSHADKFLEKIEGIQRKVNDLPRLRETWGIDEHRGDQTKGAEKEDWDERRSFPHTEEPNVTGFEDHIRNLVAKTDNKNPEVCVISITGMPGLGKTTLARKVYNSISKKFKFSAWVYVSEKPIIKNILIDIAKQVGLDKEKWGEATALHNYLSQSSYVIVIDDIWQTKDWDAIKVAIPTYSKTGSRIILTSRNRDVGVHVGGWSSLLEMEPLGESYSKLLFETCLGPVETEYDPPGLREIGEKISYKCGGVPLAIVVLSGLLKLRERSLSAWTGVLDQINQGEGELSKNLALSYIDLPTELKPCFLYFGMFPEDYEIYTFDLINLWVAEGFIKRSGTREVENVGNDYLNRLIARNLIQVVERYLDGMVRSCRIHDLLRSLCIQEAKKIDFFVSPTDLTRYDCESVRRFTTNEMCLNDHISSNQQTPKLRSLLYFEENKDYSTDMNLLSTFFKDVNLVHVLLLSINNSSPVSKEIWSLKNLTYLKLQGHQHDRLEIPESIIILENLVTLDFRDLTTPPIGVRGTKLHFPMIIWNMKQLRHILLPNDLQILVRQNEGFNPKEIMFKNLQTLDLDGAIFKADWFYKLSEIKVFKISWSRYGKVEDPVAKIANVLLNSAPTLSKLETLHFKYSGGTSVSKLNLLGYHKLSNLFLKNVTIGKWPQPDELPPNLTKIVLENCSLNEDPLQVMKKIPKLIVLKLIMGKYLSHKFICTGEPGNFPHLEQLYMLQVSLDHPYEITIEDGGMPKLKEFVTTQDQEFILKLPVRIADIRRKGHWYTDHSKFP